MANHLLRLIRGPWQLIYYEAYLNRADALGREKYLKSGDGRKFLKDTAEALFVARAAQLKTRGEAFTRYTHVLNRPGIGVKSPLD